MKTKITQNQKNNWVNDLRNQKYPQCQYILIEKKSHHAPLINANIGSCCVLGIFLARNNKKSLDNGNTDSNAYEYLNNILGEQLVSKLIDFNDCRLWSFKKLASYIERYVEPKD